ncbi:MAG: hypothetical protein AAGA28_12460 [Pseudomonadota bacterium]
MQRSGFFRSRNVTATSLVATIGVIGSAWADTPYNGGVVDKDCGENKTCNFDFDVDAHHIEFDGYFYCSFENSTGVGVFEPKKTTCSSPNSAITCSVSDSSPGKRCECNQKEQKTEYDVKVKVECGSAPPPSQ